MTVTDAGVGLNKQAKSAAGSRSSLLMALLVLVIHLLAIALLLHDRAETPDRPREQLIQFRLLPAATLKPVSPMLDTYRPLPSGPLAIYPLAPLAFDIDGPVRGPAATEPPGREDAGLFDPRLRKKLSEIGSHTAAQSIQELKTWTDASGTKIVEVAQGECIRAMPGNANARGDNWSLRFKCGKNESERMIDNINADMAERNRKRPAK